MISRECGRYVINELNNTVGCNYWSKKTHAGSLSHALICFEIMWNTAHASIAYVIDGVRTLPTGSPLPDSLFFNLGLSEAVDTTARVALTDPILLGVAENPLQARRPADFCSFFTASCLSCYRSHSKLCALSLATLRGRCRRTHAERLLTMAPKPSTIYRRLFEQVYHVLPLYLRLLFLSR